jgi:hypothetical protein
MFMYHEISYFPQIIKKLPGFISRDSCILRSTVIFGIIYKTLKKFVVMSKVRKLRSHFEWSSKRNEKCIYIYIYIYTTKMTVLQKKTTSKLHSSWKSRYPFFTKNFTFHKNLWKIKNVQKIKIFVLPYLYRRHFSIILLHIFYVNKHFY